MDSLPVDLPPPERIPEMTRVSLDSIEVGKYYFLQDTDHGHSYLIQVTQINSVIDYRQLPTRVYTREVEYNPIYEYVADYRTYRHEWRVPVFDFGVSRIRESEMRESQFGPRFKLYKPLDSTIYQKAKVQAVKDILAKKGIPEETSSGPLGTILGMAGIKQPPKQSGVGRRKTRKSKSKRSKKTRKH